MQNETGITTTSEHQVFHTHTHTSAIKNMSFQNSFHYCCRNQVSTQLSKASKEDGFPAGILKSYKKMLYP